MHYASGIARRRLKQAQVNPLVLTLCWALSAAEYTLTRCDPYTCTSCIHIFHPFPAPSLAVLRYEPVALATTRVQLPTRRNAG